MATLYVWTGCLRPVWPIVLSVCRMFLWNRMSFCDMFKWPEYWHWKYHEPNLIDLLSRWFAALKTLRRLKRVQMLMIWLLNANSAVFDYVTKVFEYLLSCICWFILFFFNSFNMYGFRFQGGSVQFFGNQGCGHFLKLMCPFVVFFVCTLYWLIFICRFLVSRCQQWSWRANYLVIEFIVSLTVFVSERRSTWQQDEAISGVMIRWLDGVLGRVCWAAAASVHFTLCSALLLCFSCGKSGAFVSLDSLVSGIFVGHWSNLILWERCRRWQKRWPFCCASQKSNLILSQLIRQAVEVADDFLTSRLLNFIWIWRMFDQRLALDMLMPGKADKRIKNGQCGAADGKHSSCCVTGLRTAGWSRNQVWKSS